MANIKIIQDNINKLLYSWIIKFVDNIALDNLNKLYKHAKKVKYIGHGSDGIVFSISNDRVFKLTYDKNEALIYNDMLLNKEKYNKIKNNIPEVYKVRKINEFLFVIEMKEYKLAIDKDDERIQQMFYLEHFINSRCNYSKVKKSKFLKDMKVYHNDTSFVEKIIEIIDELKKVGVIYTDVFYKNILTDGVNIILIDYAKSKVSDQLVNSQIITM